MARRGAAFLGAGRVAHVIAGWQPGGHGVVNEVARIQTPSQCQLTLAIATRLAGLFAGFPISYR